MTFSFTTTREHIGSIVFNTGVPVIYYWIKYDTQCMQETNCRTVTVPGVLCPAFIEQRVEKLPDEIHVSLLVLW